jgi:TRAP-type mannitol/chloroaromatic compound transport system substrate-binding protein
MAQKEWCDLLEKEHHRQDQVQHPAARVSPAPGTMDAVKNGLADISFTVHGYTPGRFVLTQMAEVPFLGDKAEPLGGLPPRGQQAPRLTPSTEGA